MAEPDYRSARPLTYGGPQTEAAIAMHRAAQTVKATGGSVEIGGVKIAPCDTFGRTDTERAEYVHGAVPDILAAATVGEAIGLAVGAASSCWDNLSGAGVFESQTAASIVDALTTRISTDPAPRTVHAITSVKLTPTGSGAQQLLVTDDTGRVLDFSSAVFNDRLAVREVGEEDGFRQFGLDVTLVLSPGSETCIAAPAVVPPAMPVPPAAATEQWVRLDGVGHLETISLVPDPASTVTIGYAKYRDLLRQTGWQEVQDR